MKRLGLISALWALFLCSGAFAAGTIPYSLSQQNDEFGVPLAGGRLYLIQAGTVATPQNCYQDSGLTLVLPNPIILDASGRAPQIFCADGSIKVRLTKSNGVNVVTADGILVVGASSGGSGGSPVDATTVLATGDVKARYGTGILSGFVRLNGRTIGSATSGATERANADAQALFEYLWTADANLTVSTGRGVSGNADWVANKTLTLPDMRGRGITALADMGNSAATTLTSATCATPTALGTICGTETKTILQANLPNVNFTNSGIAVSVGTLTLNANIQNLSSPPVGSVAIPLVNVASSSAGFPATVSSFWSGSPSVTSQGSAASGGSGTAISALNPIMLFTVYCKL